jgi:thiamine pyrophosphokinase
MQFVAFDPHFRVDVLTSGGSFRSRPGDRVSVVPLPFADGVHYQGLRYPLEGESLAFGTGEGTCNEATAERFRLSFSNGAILLFRQLFPQLSTHPFDEE